MGKNDRPKYNPSKKHEDQLLRRYFRSVGGLVFTEVRVGQGGIRKYPQGAKHRRIDAVRLATSRRRLVPFIQATIPEFARAVRNRTLEVIEVKRRLNRPAIGQVIVGATLVEMEYPQLGRVRQVILCETGDPVLEQVCRKLGIRVWKSN